MRPTYALYVREDRWGKLWAYELEDLGTYLGVGDVGRELLEGTSLAPP